jgi:hydroxymethylpyrimidine pyrophosphatase-like HAD family hydrolase
MKIAVDFDGTIVENRYPAIGEEMMFAFATLNALQKKGHQLILWTYRVGRELDEAVEFCRKHGIEFEAANLNYEGEEVDEKTPRKLNVDCFIDDRNVGGFLGWGKVYQLICPDGDDFTKMVLDYDAHHNYDKYKGLKKRILYSLSSSKGL